MRTGIGGHAIAKAIVIIKTCRRRKRSSGLIAQLASTPRLRPARKKSVKRRARRKPPLRGPADHSVPRRHANGQIEIAPGVFARPGSSEELAYAKLLKRTARKRKG